MSDTSRNAHDALVDMFDKERELRQRENRVRQMAQDTASVVVANAVISVSTPPASSCDTSSSSSSSDCSF